MKRLAVIIGFFLLLAVVQNSFFASLPGALPLFPLILTVGVYLLQHQSQSLGGWLIVANGIFFDYWHLQNVPLETLSYSLTALAAWYMAKHVFSNRSLYGVLACGLTSLVILKVMQMGILGLLWLRETESVSWDYFYQEAFWTALLMISGLIILFPFANRIKKILQKTFFLPQRETF